MEIQIQKRHGFDLVACPHYMYIGFKFRPPIVRLVREPLADGPDLEPLRKIRKVGDRRKGFNSAGFAVVEMIPDSWLEYAGRHTTEKDGDILLFHAFDEGRPILDEYARHLKYKSLYLGFYDIGEMLMFVRTGRASRGVAKVVEYL